MKLRKRALDLVAGIGGVILVAPLYALIAILIKLDDGGPVFFLQERVGLGGRPFKMWKFRTMRAGPSQNGQLTVGQDPRITRVGRWLRELKLDELPQLLHLISGRMTLVGPRPEVPRYVAHYTPEQRRVLDLVPGITGPASLRYWDESGLLAKSSDPERAYLTQIVPEKIRVQVEYASRATLWTDLGLVLMTVGRLWPKARAFMMAPVVRYRRPLILGVHVLLCVVAYFVAYSLRFDFMIPPADFQDLLKTLPLLLILRVAMHARFGLFRGYWQHFGIQDLLELIKATTLGSIAFLAGLFVIGAFPGVPRSVLVLEWVVVIFLSGGVRLAARYLREAELPFTPPTGRRALVIGTGDKAERLVREVRRQVDRSLRVVGLVAEEAGDRNRSIHGVRVVGSVDELLVLAARHRADLIVIALDAPRGDEMQRVVGRCTDTGLAFKTMPSLQELLDGSARIDQLRNVRVEDLLGREPVRLDDSRVEADVRGRVVMVTGGAGSIGSELATQIAKLRPQRLVLLDQSESALYFISLDIQEANPGLDVVSVVGDITDQQRLSEVFAEHRPNYVIHAAAYKHVPLLEGNVVEAVRNNVFGTLLVANTAATWGTEKFVLISTDKAVNPSSVMGATKRVAERVVLDMMAQRNSGTDFRAVRFGNVLGSAGSVVPLFERQVASGGPVTVTHPDVERYFMTIPEAAQLVLQAGSLDGAGGRIAMLDMGRPVRIVELAERLIRLAGLEPHRDVRIVFTGLRPGEKLHEELTSAHECAQPTVVEKIRIVQTGPVDGASMVRRMDRLARAVKRGTSEGVLTYLCELVPECAPTLRAKRDAERTVHSRPRPAEQLG